MGIFIKVVGKKVDTEDLNEIMRKCRACGSIPSGERVMVGIISRMASMPPKASRIYIRIPTAHCHFKNSRSVVMPLRLITVVISCNLDMMTIDVLPGMGSRSNAPFVVRYFCKGECKVIRQ